MYIVVVYDAGENRNKKLLSICRRYLNHVQKSVFEGNISDGKLKKMKKEMQNVMNLQDDSCVIYCIGNTRYCRKEQIGRYTSSIEDF